MAAQYGKLVNKQFNSPINLYSENNIRDVLDRETQMLSNGAVGINFHNPLANKPASLQNSAVLRFLEEEESKQRGGSPSLKRVAWPPPPEAGGHLEEISSENVGAPQIISPGLQNNQLPSANCQQTSPTQQGFPSNCQQRSDPFNYYPPHEQYQPLQVTPTSPLYQPSSPLHYSPVQGPKGWAPVHSPIYNKPQPQFPTSQPQHQYPQHQQQQHYSPQNQSFPSHQFESTVPIQQQQQYQPVPTTIPRQQQHPSFAEPPPSTITLRPQAPVSQKPAPVYTSQPATATLQGGKNLRGDLKWPPPETKAQMEEDNKKRIELARGPVCRPRKINRDYTGFFAQNALNDTYPKYKIPPGTQFYVRE
ncbi:hypothetical protein FQA39_LY00422 [Lamprigera yunnana]|nr:hypothetical protein FQA39_LY00422 [Lamprigera yunnana]